MHELSVTESLLEIALRHAASARASRINTLFLVIGQLSTIVDESVQVYWDIVAKGTPAEGARLEFHRIPARFTCQDCKSEYTPSGKDLACPQCGSVRVRLISGDEFRLEAIDVE